MPLQIYKASASDPFFEVSRTISAGDYDYIYQNQPGISLASTIFLPLQEFKAFNTLAFYARAERVPTLVGTPRWSGQPVIFDTDQNFSVQGDITQGQFEINATTDLDYNYQWGSAVATGSVNRTPPSQDGGILELIGANGPLNGKRFYSNYTFTTGQIYNITDRTFLALTCLTSVALGETPPPIDIVIRGFNCTYDR